MRCSTAPSAVLVGLLLVLGGASCRTSDLTDIVVTLPANTLGVGRGPALAFSPSGDFVATSGEELRIWRVSDGHPVVTLDCPARVSALAFSPDARYLAGVLDEGPRDTKRIFVWSLSIEPLQPGGPPRPRRLEKRLVFPCGRSTTNGPVAYNRDGDLIAIVTSANVRATKLAVWTHDGRALERPFGEHPTTEKQPRTDRPMLSRHYWDPCIFRADFSRDGSVVAVGRQDRDGALELLCADTGDRLVTFESAARVSVFAVANETVAGAIAPNVVRLWSRQDGSRKADLEGRWDAGDDTLWALSFSPSGGLVAGGGLAGRIHIWSVADGKRIREIRAHGGVICALAFSPRGDVIASAGWDGAVKFWDIEGLEAAQTR